MLYRSSQWSSDNEGPQNISDSVNNSDSSGLKESEEELDLDEDDVFEVCSCSCDEKTCDSDIDEDDLNTVYVGIDQADSLCIKLNKLIETGKIQRDRIFYKVINDVVQIMYDPFHPYDREVIELFNTITYLGGKATTCFIRSPMNLGDGKDSHRTKEKKMNLGGPSESVCRKYQAAYTPDPGVIKALSFAFINLVKGDGETAPLLKSDNLEVTPCAFANDGTSLKPAIEFEWRLKENVGLKFKVDLAYIKEHTDPSADDLRNNIITEAIVSSLPTLDNKFSLPCAVDYATQKGKTGEAMANKCETHIKTVQTCEACQRRTPGQRNILTLENIRCKSFCNVCYEKKGVCEECLEKVHISYVPSLKRCGHCLDNGLICRRMVVLVLSTDCESGNKTAFEIFKSKIENGEIDPYLSLLSILPDCPHVGKSLKVSFSNWWLKCGDERSNLSQLRSLRNRSDNTTKEKFRKLLPKNDHVKNKDRQDASAVLELTKQSVIDELSQTGYVCQTIIPQLDKFTQENRMGMIPSPISIAAANYGWILFLAFDEKSNTSTLYKARLHSPVDKLISLKKGTRAKEVHYVQGIAFLACESGPLKATEVLPDAITISLKGKGKADLEEIANQLKLSSLGTVREIKSRIEGHFKRIELKYDGLLVSKEDIVFSKNDNQPSFEAMVCVDNKLLYATKNSVGDQREVVQLILQSDGVGLECNEEHAIVSCDEEWGKVHSMCISENSLFLSNQRGISRIDLTTRQHSLILHAPNDPCKLTKFGPDLLFSNQKSCSVWKLRSTGEEDVFAGKEEGSFDGPVTTCCFKQPMGIATEFDSVVYVCDAQTNSIKLLSKMNHCAKFLRAIDAIYEAFSVHNKGGSYEKKTTEEAIGLVRHCKTVLEEHAYQIRAESNITDALNGPQGHVSAKTVNSVQLMEWGLGRLADILGEYDYKALDLLKSCNVKHNSERVFRYFVSAVNSNYRVQNVIEKIFMLSIVIQDLKKSVTFLCTPFANRCLTYSD